MKETWIRVYSKLLKGSILNEIGPALGLLLYLMDKSTHQQDNICVVLGGKPLTYKYFSSKLNIGERTVTRHSKLLTKLGFIYSLKVCGNKRIWFVMAYKMLNDDTQYSQRINSLVRRAHLGIINDIKAGFIKPINPFIELIDNSVTIQHFRETKKSNSCDKVSLGRDKNDFSHDKIVHSNKDNTVDNTKDKTGDRKYKDKSELIIPPSSNVDHASVMEAFGHYMETIGSNRRIPEATEYNLVENILMHEDVSTLLACIDNYKEKVHVKPNWSFLPPEKFFSKNFYIRFLKSEKCSSYVPRNKERDPGRIIDNKKSGKE